jgi:hypothetical protein
MPTRDRLRVDELRHDAVMAPDALTVEELDRWVRFGVQWRLVEVAESHAVVDLCACTGEPVERRMSSDPAVIAHVRAQSGLSGR